MLSIVPYNPAWPADFARIAAGLCAGLGDLALRVDHIGSTSVPGLPSKDIIDVQLSVASFDPPLVQRLAALGYTLREGTVSDHRPPNDVRPDSEWEKRYFAPPAGQRATHLHVRIPGRANWRYPLLFRDYLRAHPAMAAGSAELKRRLAAAFPEDRLTYTEIKDPVCDMVVAAAEDWAAQTGWTP